MRALFQIMVSSSLLACASLAEELTTESCLAPDSLHKVVLRGGNDGDGDSYKLAILDLNSGTPILSRSAQGYAAFKLATEPANFRCRWSPDSKLVAIFERGTKRSGVTSIYRVKARAVQEIPFPDLMPLIRPHLTAEMRALWLRPEEWLPGHGLRLSVEGTQMDEAHGNFRFVLTLQMRADEKGRIAAKVASFRPDRSIPGSIK